MRVHSGLCGGGGRRRGKAITVPTADYAFTITHDGTAVVTYAASDGRTPRPNRTMRENILGKNKLHGDGGYIDDGETHSILYGQSLTVTAKADEGYKFFKWSDGTEEAQRTDENITGPIEITAYFKRIKLQVSYTATEGGKINGNTEQAVYYGHDAETVTAEPYEGFSFVKWSDNGSANPERNDTKITTEIYAVAEFEETNKIFTYTYNKATGNNTEKSIKLTYNSLFETSFAVPLREHYIFEGWYLESEFNTRISDEQGGFLLDYKIFDFTFNNIYAKWTVEEEITFKILMVFATEIKAKLPLDSYINGEKADVYYKMSDTERRVCELIPGQIEKILNETFDGLVTFEVDAYFTTIALDESSFKHKVYSGGIRSFYISAELIPEVGPVLKDYRSVIATFSMGDHDKTLHKAGGCGSEKYACMYLETFLAPVDRGGATLEELEDLSDPYWRYIVYVYLHEFTHTLEQSSSIYGYRGAAYDSVLSSYTTVDGLNLEFTKLYLLDQAKVNGVNGERGGIPYFFWKGEIDVLVQYFIDDNSLMGGYINGKSFLDFMVPFGGTAAEITAVAENGYRFVKWSDGVITATRQDTNITSFLIVTAIFERI